MLVKIPDLINPTQLEAACSVLRQSKFVDGKLSAGKHARTGKNNRELAAAQYSYDALNNVVMTQLVQHPTYLQTAMPAKICAPIYARYTAGMEYGGHIDDPIMGPLDSRYRSDISISIFLTGPDEYQGGELCIESSEGSTEFKLPAGHAILEHVTDLLNNVKNIKQASRDFSNHTRGSLTIATTHTQAQFILPPVELLLGRGGGCRVGHRRGRHADRRHDPQPSDETFPHHARFLS